MWTKIKFLQVAVLALLLLQVLTLLFFYMRRPPHPREGALKYRITELLSLDDEQKKAYDSLIQAHQHQIRGLETAIASTRKELYEEGLKNDQFQLQDSLITRMGVLLSDVESAHFEHFMSLKKICRPEQVKSFDAVIEAMKPYFFPKGNRPPPKKHE